MCIQCTKHYEAYKSVGKNRKFCSVNCYREHSKKYKIGFYNSEVGRDSGVKGGKAVHKKHPMMFKRIGYWLGKSKGRKGGLACQRMFKAKNMNRYNSNFQRDMGKRAWKNKDKMIAAILKGLFKRPTSFERAIIEFNQLHHLNFEYVGNGSFFINHKNPDFVDKKRKIVIEVFHSWFKIRDYGSIERYKTFCREKYESAGWKVCFFDENDVRLKNFESIK